MIGRGIGARAAFGVGPNSETPNPSFGGAVYERAFGVFSGTGLSVRYFDELWFGGDTRDLSYSLDMDLAVGPEFQLAEGLYLRLRPSFRGTYRQDAGLSFNSLRFPGGEVAFGVVTPEVELDLALHGALNLLGYFHGFGIDAPLAGGAYGASLSATFFGKVPLRLDLDAAAFVPRRGEEGIEFGVGTPDAFRYHGPNAGVAVDATAHACAHLWSHPQRPTLRTGSPERPVILGKHARDYWLSACVDLRYSRFSHTVASAAVTTPGFSLVFGKVSRLDPHGKP